MHSRHGHPQTLRGLREIALPLQRAAVLSDLPGTQLSESAMETINEAQPLIPARMLNEYVYCPRLANMMWVQGEFVHNADTVEGVIRHKRVDKASGKLPADPVEEPEKIHARSVYGGLGTWGLRDGY